MELSFSDQPDTPVQITLCRNTIVILGYLLRVAEGPYDKSRIGDTLSQAESEWNKSNDDGDGFEKIEEDLELLRTLALPYEQEMNRAWKEECRLDALLGAPFDNKFARKSLLELTRAWREENPNGDLAAFIGHLVLTFGKATKAAAEWALKMTENSSPAS